MIRRSFPSFLRIFSRSLAKQAKPKEKTECKESKLENLTAVLYGIRDLRLEKRPTPKINDNQVLLQMESVGICGSDVHFLVEGKIGPFVVEKPMVIGHEASGTVVELGKNVKNLCLGDRVAIEPGIGCRMCSYCREGRYNLCPNMKFCATPPIDGNLCQYYAHDADFCFKLPECLSFDDGALMEPLAVAVHCCKRGKVKFGDRVLVMGAGPIGLACMFAAKAMGASTVTITDVVHFRLKNAMELGADQAYRMCKDMTDEQSAKELQELLGGRPHVTIECSGAEKCFRVAFEATRSGGTVVLAGMDKLEMNLSLTSPIFREVDIKGIFRYNNDYPTAIEMVRNGKVNMSPLISHHFKIEDTLKAFETAQTKEGNPIKIMIHPNPKWNECK